jgi:hypothetical protein
MIWDCGAFFYRSSDVPQIGKELVTPLWAINQYLKRKAQPGHLVVAPDWILVPRTNLNQQRDYNGNSAIGFLKLAPIHLPHCHAMAVAHGLTVAEKVRAAIWLYDIGYRAIALGGMAINSSQKQGNIAAIRAVKSHLPPDCYVHVFGLSSPDYARAFSQIGINSFDSSSWLRESFWGLFYEAREKKLIKHLIPKCPGTPVTIPTCPCLACSSLKRRGIETRTMGSRAANLGRAIHNLGQLTLAQRISSEFKTTIQKQCKSTKESAMYG